MAPFYHQIKFLQPVIYTRMKPLYEQREHYKSQEPLGL